MDYWCRLGSLSNASSASGSSNPGGTVGPSYSFAAGPSFFKPRYFPYSLFTSHLLPFVLCLISFLLFPCASVWKYCTFVDEFHVSYGHTEWNLLSSRESTDEFCKRSES